MLWILLFSVGCTLTPSPASTPAPVTVAGGDDEALREFVSRLLEAQLPPDASSEQSFLLVGKLPERLPFMLSTPDDAAILGSWRRDDWLGTQVLLETSWPASNVMDFYTTALEDQGFRPQADSPGARQWVDSNLFWTELCRAGDHSRVAVSAFNTEDSLTKVELDIQTNPRYVTCLAGETGMADFAQSLIPTLKHPSGAVHWSGGGGGSAKGRADTNVAVEVDMSVADLEAHYAVQLEAAGWRQIEVVRSEAAAWSLWQFTDSESYPWQGSMLVVASPQSLNRRFIWVEIERQ